MTPNPVWQKHLRATGLQTVTQARTDVLHPSKAEQAARQPQPSTAAPAGANHTKPFGAATGIVPKHQGRRKSAARQAPTCSASKPEESEPRQTGFSTRLGAHPPRLSRFLTRLRPPPGKFLIALPSPGSLSAAPTPLFLPRELRGVTHAAEERRDPQESRPLPGLLWGSSAVTAKRVTLRCPVPGDGTMPLQSQP